MDITPSSACALRKRLWGLFNIYSTVVSSSDGVCEAAEARRLEAPRYHSCISAFARLGSFRNLFLGSEDDGAIRAAATELQSRLTQDLLWREALGREAICAGQQQHLNTLETKSTAGTWFCKEDNCEENMHRKGCDSFEADSHGTHSTPSEDTGAADAAKGSISWITFHSVIVLYLYDEHCFHRSFLASDVDALRSGNSEGQVMHAGLEGRRVKEKRSNMTAMTRLAQTKVTCAVAFALTGEIEALELSSQHRHINFVMDIEGVDSGQPVFDATVSAAASSSSCLASSEVFNVVPKEVAAAVRRHWPASPSPRRPEGAMKGFGDESSPVSSTPPVARTFKLRPQSPSQQNVMAGRPHPKATHQPFEYPHRKHRTRHADAASPEPAVANRRVQAHRMYTTRRPPAPKLASPANAAPEFKALEGGAGTTVWAGRSEYSCDVKIPPTSRHEECFCEAGESASFIPTRLEHEQAGEPSGSGGYAEGRRTTAFAVEVVRGASAEASSGNDSSQPLWARGTSLAKPSPSCAASDVTQDLEDTANDQEVQQPPTQTSRRRSSLHQFVQSSPFPFGEPLPPLSLKEERRAGAAAAQATVMPVRHATAPSPTPTPREDESSAWRHSAVYREASAAAPTPPLHQLTMMQQVAQRRPRQPQPQHRPLRPLSPQKLIGMPCILSPSYTSPLDKNRGSRVSEMARQHRSLIPAPTSTTPIPLTRIPSASCETAHRLLAGTRKMESAVMEEEMHTPTRCRSLGPQGLTCRTPINAVSPVTRQPTAAVSPALATTPHQQQHVDGRSPPPRLSSRARVRSMSRGSHAPMTPPRVPSTRILLSPSGSVQATPPPSVSYPTQL